LETLENRTLLSVVFTDIEGFSALTQKDERQALEFVKRYRKIITEFTETFRGDLIHFYGDGSLTTHRSAYDAVQCAIKMQSALSEDPQIPVRIGVHLGEVVFTDDTIYGNAVNIASRIQSLGSARTILISGSIAREMENQMDIETIFIGPEYVKNIKEPVDIYAISSTGLVIPSRNEVHERNKVRRKSPYIITVIIGIAIVFSLFSETLSNYLPWGNDILDARILVLPFTNETGDTTLDQFSMQAAISISSMLEDVEGIKLVSMHNIWGTRRFTSFGSLPYLDLSRTTSAENFISGQFAYENDSTIVISTALINGTTGNPIEKFPRQFVDRYNRAPGLYELGKRIIGYLISAEYHPLSPPNQDAFYAYNEARRVWGQNNYVDSRRYLLRAIAYDSTFLDAYFLLSDTYFNLSDFSQADSIFRDIEERFKTETINDRKRNEFYYYQALYKGDYRSAHKYVMNDYNRDKTELFTNTTAANYSLFFVNDPKLSIKILRKISFNDIDFEFPDNRLRITTGIQAYCSLGKYKKASKLASLYPSNGMTLRHHKMKIQIYAGLLDTGAINTELTSVKLNFTANDYVGMLYWAKQKFTLQGNNALADAYLRKTYRAVVDHNTTSDIKSKVFYDMGRLREGLDYALFLYQYAPYYAPYVALAGQGYALMGDQDSAVIYLDILRDTSIIEYSLGESHYQEACLLTFMGDYESALVRLGNAVNDGLIFYEDNAGFDPHLIPLFERPEFQKIIHPIGK